jgi:hypothetical protein
LFEVKGGNVPDARRLGLLSAFFPSIPAQLEDEWNDWYDIDHVPERMETPGFLNCARYKAIEAGEQHLCLYDLAAPEVLKTSSYRQTGAPTNWTARLRGSIVRHPTTRRVYEQRTVEFEMLPPGLCSALWLDAMSVVDASRKDFEKWLDSEYLPALRSLPGVARVRSFWNIDNGPEYMLFADAVLPEIFATNTFLELQDEVMKARLRFKCRDIGFGKYRLIYSYPKSYLPDDRPVDWASVSGGWRR